TASSCNPGGFTHVANDVQVPASIGVGGGYYMTIDVTSAVQIALGTPGFGFIIGSHSGDTAIIAMASKEDTSFTGATGLTGATGVTGATGQGYTNLGPWSATGYGPYSVVLY